MSRFAVLCPNAVGHLLPNGGLGVELQSRGHEVTVFANRGALAFVQQLGLRTHEIPTSEEELPQSHKFKSWVARRLRIRNLLELRNGLSLRAQTLFRSVPRVVQERDVDGLIVDQISFAGGTIAEHLGLPYVTVCGGLPWMIAEPNIPPIYVPWAYAETPKARLVNRIYRSAERVFWRPLVTVVNRQRVAWGLRPWRRIRDSLSPLAVFGQLCPELDFPYRALPATFHYTGPLDAPRHSSPADFPWGELDGRPLIFASMGTVHPRANGRIFARIAEACAGLEAQLVISRGKWQSGFEVPSSSFPKALCLGTADGAAGNWIYPAFLAEELPIGSGITEAACTTLAKKRLCGSGIHWKAKGAGIVLSLCALIPTVRRRTQFWEKIPQFRAESYG